MNLADIEKNLLAWLPFGAEQAVTMTAIERNISPSVATVSLNFALGKLRKRGLVGRVVAWDDAAGANRPSWYRTRPTPDEATTR